MVLVSVIVFSYCLVLKVYLYAHFYRIFQHLENVWDVGMVVKQVEVGVFFFRVVVWQHVQRHTEVGEVSHAPAVVFYAGSAED